jgi:hypothetical protein
MAYDKQVWVDKPTLTTPMSAARFNHLEDGVATVDAAASAAATAAAAAQTTAAGKISQSQGDARYAHWAGQWTANTAYGANTIVMQAGLLYFSTVAVASRATFTLSDWTQWTTAAAGGNITVLSPSDTTTGVPAGDVVLKQLDPTVNGDVIFPAGPKGDPGVTMLVQLTPGTAYVQTNGRLFTGYDVPSGLLPGDVFEQVAP